MLNKSDYKRFSEKMDKSIAVLEDQLTQIRAGRANPSILNKITVEYYGVPTPLNQLGSINVPEARMLV
ncbi:MAG TPA: ribosome recycling factor, partial [Clostridia bacterium]|nr:ribosome recycling factor [Clostridia bacterium]